MTARVLVVAVVGVISVAALAYLTLPPGDRAPLAHAGGTTLVGLGVVLLVASLVIRLTPELARTWRPELGYLQFFGMLPVATALVSKDMVIAAIGALMVGSAGLVTTLRTARLRSR